MGIGTHDIGTDTGEKLISLDVRGADVLRAETVCSCCIQMSLEWSGPLI